MLERPTPGYVVHRAAASAAAAAAFASVTLPFLARRETLNNLPLSLLDRLAQGRHHDAVLLHAEDEHGDVAAVLMRTPPHALVVAHGGSTAAREALLATLLDERHELPAMVGPLPEVAEAAAWWSERAGVAMRRGMHLGVYRLRQVRPSARTRGRMRLAAAGDAELVVPWLAAFELEALGRPSGDPTEIWSSFVHDPVRRLYLWEDEGGRTVCVVGRSGRTPNGFRIGPVYTPPQWRRRGYAEALVAAVSQAQLDEGARFCFLFTDLAFPTSNSVYRAVGYEFVGEAAEELFVPS